MGEDTGTNTPPGEETILHRLAQAIRTGMNHAASRPAWAPRARRTAAHGLLRPLLMLIIAWGLGLAPSHGAAPPADPGEAAPPRKFSIGFLNDGSDLNNAPALMSRLSQYLLARKDLKATLARNHYQTDEILLSPCDGTRDMAQRMAENEFDLVFATAVVYARQIGPTYEPILQTLRPGDKEPPRGEGGVLRRGVIFIGPHAAAFNTATSARERADQARRLLAGSPLAVPTADSAAGYISPRLMLIHDLGLQKTAGFLFCGSDTEVVKHVVSGLADIGACREGALAILPPPAKGRPFYQVLLQSLPTPTDPILVHAELLPARSELGLELKVALREFFNKDQLAGADLRVENASKRAYEMLADTLHEVEEKRPGAPAAPAVGEPDLHPALPLVESPQPPAATPTSTPSPEPAALAPALPPELGAPPAGEQARGAR